VPFYAGWGLTQDEMAVSRRRRQRSLAELFAGAYLRYSHYFDCWTRKPVTLETAIDQLSFLRQSYLGNRSPVVFYKMPRWKREPLRRLLDGPGVSFTHSSSITDALSQSRGKTAAIAAWGKTANQVRSEIEKAGATLLSVEDGFLRSAGLGAALTASLSYTFDKTGIYYDPETPSDLEHLLQNHSCDDALLARAQRMREAIVSGGFSKYNLSSRQMPQLAADGRRKMLVIGQVADDEAVRRSLAAPDHNINLTMLLALQPRRPEAFLIYKPHPDVEKLGRAGKIDEGRLQELCDAVLHDVAISDALALADEVAVFTSLAGFEALLRNKAVRCFGRPFYAGWGLTADQQSIARRTRQLSVEELVAISLIIYPRYYDPLSKLPATPEMALSRLADMRLAPRTAASRAKEIAGRSLIYLRRLKKD
jgi:capsular polysaccharide export protein